ncbi:MAG: metallophosphoesterase, partial [Pyrinomonadaceae bacterium]
MENRLVQILTLAVIVGICLLCYATFVEPQRLVVNHATIAIKKLDPAFDGLRIVMLGDIHGGSNYVTEERLRTVVARANEQEADIVVLLGDYVSETVEDQP